MALPSDNKTGYALPDDAVWLITGCSSGLGLSLAQLIAAHPTHRLVATARDPSKIRDVVPSSPRVLIVALDVTSPSSITSALDMVLEHPAFGRIDVLGKPALFLSSSTTLLSHHLGTSFKLSDPNKSFSEQCRLRINGRHGVFPALFPQRAILLRR